MWACFSIKPFQKSWEITNISFVTFPAMNLFRAGWKFGNGLFRQFILTKKAEHKLVERFNTIFRKAWKGINGLFRQLTFPENWKHANGLFLQLTFPEPADLALIGCFGS